MQLPEAKKTKNNDQGTIWIHFRKE